MTTATSLSLPRLLTRGDLIDEFGASEEKRIDYILQREEFVPLGRIGPTRLFPVTILPRVRELLQGIQDYGHVQTLSHEPETSELRSLNSRRSRLSS